MTRNEAVNFLTRHPEKFGQMVGFTKLKDLHRQWMRKMLLGRGDMTLQGHRSAYKTTCLSIVLALIIILLPNKRTLFARKTDDDVKEIIEQVKKILTNPKTVYFVQVIYGVNLKMTTDNAMEISTNLTTDARGTSQLVGMGIGGSITGKHFDFIFTDDIVNLKDRKSKAERERTKAIYQELLNIVNRPDGRIINTGTPWHVEDAFVLMPPAEKYDCYTTGLMSEEEIRDKREHMAPSLFAANYELVHIASEGALFTDPPKFITKERAEEILGKGAVPEDLFRDGIAHIDAAYDGEDYSAYTAGRRRGNRLFMYGKIWRKHVDTVLPYCISETKRLMCGPIREETNGDKGYLAKEIVRGGHSAAPYNEKENKYIKISTFLRKWWKDIEWLEGTDTEYLNQILNYTEDAEHDDAPDSAACVCRELDRQSGEDYVSPFSRGGRSYHAG